MLASALDSHPDICCGGEHHQQNTYRLGQTPGKVKGCITHYNMFINGIVEDRPSLKDVSKVIVLLRDIEKRVGYSGKSHYKRPEVVEIKPGVRYDPVDHSQLERFVEGMPHLVLTYEEMTGNQDMRVIPEHIGMDICEFLGVNYKPLQPVFYKPTLRAQNE